MKTNDIRKKSKELTEFVRMLARENEQLRKQQPEHLVEEIAILRAALDRRDEEIGVRDARIRSLHIEHAAAHEVMPLLVEMNQEGVLTAEIHARLNTTHAWQPLLRQYSVIDGKLTLVGDGAKRCADGDPE